MIKVSHATSVPDLCLIHPDEAQRRREEMERNRTRLLVYRAKRRLYAHLAVRELVPTIRRRMSTATSNEVNDAIERARRVLLGGGQKTTALYRALNI